MKEATTWTIVTVLLNGIIFPLIAFYLYKISRSMDKVDKLDTNFDNSLKVLDKLVARVDNLLTESTVNKEQLNYVNKEIEEIKSKLHKVSNYATRLELRLNELESKLQHHKEIHDDKRINSGAYSN